ncbi:MAG: hypothetical protein JXR44_05265 [Thiotrichales bacterium]|nr:hypothetical protein [Thiotrichales bacterium]
MKQSDQQQLHAYLDKVLTLPERRIFEQRLRQEPLLAKEVAMMQALKQQIRQHYAEIPVPVITKGLPLKPGLSVWRNLAAACLLGAFGGLAFTAGYQQGSPSSQAVVVQKNKYLVHLESDSVDKQQQLIRQLEHLYAQHGQAVEVDFIANGNAVRLLDQESAMKTRLLELIAEHPTLSLYACHSALQRAQERGDWIELMDGVQDDKTAVETVVQRLNQGWRYLKI